MADTIKGGAPVKDRCVDTRGRLRAASELPADVRARLDALFSREALEGVDADRITGPGGLTSELAGRVIEAALRAELSAHLGHTPAHANVRNGSTPKTLRTDLGAVEIRTPRDRDGSFEPQL